MAKDPEKRYRWVLPVAVTVAVVALLFAIITSVGNGTFL